MKDGTGKSYYVNSLTNETTWEKPVAPAGKTPDPAPMAVAVAQPPVGAPPMAAPMVAAGGAPGPKPYDGCMYATLVLGLIAALGGIITAAIGGFGGTVLGGVIIIIGGCIAVPAFACKNKCMMITYVVLGALAFTIGGAICGWTGFVGSVVGAICEGFLGHESEFYECSAAKDTTQYCNGKTAYSSYKTGATYDCDKVVFNSKTNDKTCCKGMKAAGKKSCVNTQTAKDCKDGKSSGAAGWVAIIFAILGCVGTCTGCCTACGSNGYFAEPPQQTMVQVNVGQPGAPQTVVQMQAQPAQGQVVQQ